MTTPCDCKALYRSSILLAASVEKSRSGALFGVPLTDIWTVAVEGQLDARMAHARLDRLRVRSLRDGQRHGRVAEVVEPETLKTDLRLGGLPVGGVDVRRVDG